MTLLSIAKDVAASVGGIQVPQSVVGNPQYAQLLALIQQSAEDLAKRHDWTILVKTHGFTPVGASEQPNSVPADFDRFAGEPTMWLASQPIGGPLGPADWAQTKAFAPHQPYPSFRFFRGSIWFTPNGPSTETVTYEYQSNAFVKHVPVAGVAVPDDDRFVSDTDTTYLPERLIRLYAIAWWKHAKGFDYAEDMSTAERELEREAGRDGGMGDIVPFGRGYENPLGPRAINAGALGILSSGGYVGG